MITLANSTPLPILGSPPATCTPASRDFPQAWKPDRTNEVDPHGKDPHQPGAKLDRGKIKAALIIDFALALQQVALVGTFGAEKYTRGGWQDVPDAEIRYTDAMWRHLLASRHEPLDKDSGLPHMSHALWNLLAVVELQNRVK